MKRKTQSRKRPKNLGVVPLEQSKPTRVKEYRWYRINDNQRWLRVEYNPVSGKIRSPYGIWQLPKPGAKLVKTKPGQSATGSSQAAIKSSSKLEIAKPEAEVALPKTNLNALLEQKEVERKLRAVSQHNAYINRKNGR